MYSVVMTEKRKTGFLLPVPLLDALREVAEHVGNKQQWQVIGAAILLLREQPERTQIDYIRKVGGAELAGGSFEDLVEEARSRSATATTSGKRDFDIKRPSRTAGQGGKTQSRVRPESEAEADPHR
jgi:hypothetical protein